MVLTGAILHDSHCALSTTSLGSLLKLNFSLHFVCRLFLQLRLSGAYVPDGRKLCGTETEFFPFTLCVAYFCSYAFLVLTYQTVENFVVSTMRKQVLVYKDLLGGWKLVSCIDFGL
jgi:hypothetical protein